MLLNLARTKRILFFGGKGGVGKTTVSAATALAMANEGKKVLLVSTDPAHNLGHLFDRPIGPQPVRLTENLEALELDPDQTVDQHLHEVASALRRLMPVQLAGEIDKHMELSRDAPGMQEAAILERIAEVVEQAREHYDLVIFDTAPSGHTARLMALPEMMSAWTDGLIKRREKADKFNAILRNLGSDNSVSKNILGGPQSDAHHTQEDKETRIRQLLNRRKQRFSQLRDSLADGDTTAFVIVLAAERLPVLETIELHKQLTTAGVNIGGMVVNKRLPDDASGFFAERKQQETAHLNTLAVALPDVPRQDLYLVAHDVVGLQAINQFVHQLRQ